MIETGWRTVIADSTSELSCSDGNLVIKTDTIKTVPLAELQTLLVNSVSTTLTVDLINELTKNNVRVVLCDQKHNPSCEISSYSKHTEAAGRLMDQVKWSAERKAEIWETVVCQKVNNQIKLLEHLHIDYPEKLNEYLYSVEQNDTTNREGQAARIYFNRLFGMSFVRHATDNVNSALNYGYTILLSCTNRILGVYGYNTELGIKHCGRTNRFNLSCDIMEPFRPFVDLIAYRNGDKELDWVYKKELISLPYMPVIYNRTRTKLQTALEDYAMRVLKSMNINNPELPQMDMNFIEKGIGLVG